MAHLPVIDADAHVYESALAIREFLDPRWRRPNLFPGDVWDRSLLGKLGQFPKSVDEQLAAMEADDIDVMVLFPTGGLRLVLVPEIDFVMGLCRAYNDALHQFCSKDPKRLKAIALLGGHDPAAAAAELRRAVTDLGAVAGMLPTNLPLRPDSGHSYWDPLYAEAERLDVALAFHPTINNTIGTQRFSTFIPVHALSFPSEQMIALCGTIAGGVFERFPKLRLGYMESGIGWVPYMMDRLDEEVEKRGAVEAPYLTKSPSEYVTSGRIFFGVECEERTIVDGVRWGLENTMLFASDYPHWDSDWPHTVKSVRERTDLSDEFKQKMLHDNAVRFYGQRLVA
jgi:uncharacterized protein